MMPRKPLSAETVKKILTELENARKPLEEMIHKIDASDANAEKIEKASQ
jgi:hypothetical protein